MVPPGVIRPAMDRMRESVFAILGPQSGKRFLDLFCGSGIMSLEAVSRGASHATLVERDHGKRKVILSNTEIAGKKTKLVIAPAERFVSRCRDTFDLVFMDAHKDDYPAYYDLVIEKVPSGGYILADNVLWGGKVLENPITDATTRIIDQFNQKVMGDHRVENLLLPLRDGVMLMKKL